MIQLVLDSYALLEWLLGQPGAGLVERRLEQAADGAAALSMSWISVGEVVYMLARKRGLPAAESFEQRLRSLPVRLVLPDEDCVLRAAHIKANAKISYADAFALELAVRLNGRIVTGDPEIMKLRLVPVVWIGPAESKPPRG